MLHPWLRADAVSVVAAASPRKARSPLKARKDCNRRLRRTEAMRRVTGDCPHGVNFRCNIFFQQVLAKQGAGFCRQRMLFRAAFADTGLDAVWRVGAHQESGIRLT
ncbi:MAG: hypothetical protein D6744_02670 [Planctomycetota bacterium]|nr:MAG: hypothetical protein D6744_02670 [Planctomycetota bacterium]